MDYEIDSIESRARLPITLSLIVHRDAFHIEQAWYIKRTRVEDKNSLSYTVIFVDIATAQLGPEIPNCLMASMLQELPPT